MSTRALVALTVVPTAVCVGLLVLALLGTTSALNRLQGRMDTLQHAVAGQRAAGRPIQTSMHAVEGGVTGMRAELGTSLGELVVGMDRVSRRMEGVVAGLDTVAGDTGTLRGVGGALTAMAGDTGTLPALRRSLDALAADTGAMAADTGGLGTMTRDLGAMRRDLRAMRAGITVLDRRLSDVRGRLAPLPQLVTEVQGLRAITPILDEMGRHVASMDRKLPGLLAARGG